MKYSDSLECVDEFVLDVDKLTLRYKNANMIKKREFLTKMSRFLCFYPTFPVIVYQNTLLG